MVNKKLVIFRKKTLTLLNKTLPDLSSHSGLKWFTFPHTYLHMHLLNAVWLMKLGKQARKERVLKALFIPDAVPPCFRRGNLVVLDTAQGSWDDPKAVLYLSVLVLEFQSS